VVKIFFLLTAYAPFWLRPKAALCFRGEYDFGQKKIPVG
jgi:hypothetical protein